MKTIFFILVLTTNILSAQTMIFLQGGLNTRTGIFSLEEHSSLVESWKSATSASMGVDVFLTKSVAISSSIEYDSYPFDTYRYYGVSVPEVWVKASSGDASEMFRISFEGRLVFPSHTKLFAYVVTGVSYTTERVGQIRLTFANLNGPDFEDVIPSHSKNYWTHTFGLGFRYFLLDGFGVDLTGKWYSDYSTRFHRSINFGFVYVL